MGSPSFSVPSLERIIASKDHQVVAVFTQAPKAKDRGLVMSNSPVHDLALLYNIPVYTPSTLKTSSALDMINQIEADVIIVVAYGFIIPPNILKAKKYGCLNIHPSQLPKYRGAAPMQRAIINGEKETAICIMQMDEGLDTGDIILQQNIPLPEDITFLELQAQCALIGGELLLQVLNNIDNIPRIKQSLEGISYAHKLTKDEAKINWNNSAYKIYCQVRGQNPWPGVYFMYDNQVIKILEADFINVEHNFLPATVIDNELSIACGSGILKIKKLQKSGKKSLFTHEFLRGTNIKSGIILQND